MLSRVCKLVVAVILLITLMLATATALVNSVDLNQYRDVISEQVYKATGRKFVLGPINVALSLYPTLSIQDVTLANADWGSEPRMVHAKELHARLALLPLLDGNVQIERVSLTGVHISLETDKRGRGNWVFGKQRPDALAAPVAVALPLFEQVRIKDMTLSYRDGQSGTSVSMTVGTLIAHDMTGTTFSHISRRAGDERHSDVRLKDLRLIWAEDDAGRTASVAADWVHALVPVPSSSGDLDRSSSLEHLRIDGLTFDYHARDVGHSLSLAFKRLVGRLPNLTLRPVDAKVNELQVKGLLFRDRMRSSRRTTSVTLNHVEIRTRSLNSPLAVQAAGRYREVPFRASAALGAVAKMGHGRTYPLEVRASASDTRIRLAGHIERSESGDRRDFKLWAKGRSLARLSRLAQRALPDIGPYEVRTRFHDTGKSYRFDDIELTLGNSRLSGAVRLGRDTTTTPVYANLDARVLDVPEILEALRGTAPPARRPEGGKERSRSRLFSERTFTPVLPRRADWRLVLHADTLITPRLVLRDVATSARLADGVLTVSPLEAKVSGGEVQGSFVFDTRSTSPALSTDLVAKHLDLGELLGALVQSDALKGTANIALSLHGRGTSMAAIAGGLDGHVRAVLKDGEAHLGGLDAIVGGTTRLIGTLFGGGSDKGTLNCLAGEFRIRDGLAKSTLLLADTGSSTVRGKGTVNLKTEALNLTVSPKPKAATLSFMVPIKVRGTLRHPTFTPSKLATARKLGGIVAAAILFPPAVVAALAELGGETNACLHLATDGDAGAQPGASNRESLRGGPDGPLGESRSQRLHK